MNLARRGEVWLADLGLAAKTRPVLIFSIPFDDQERALYTVVPHTTATRGGRFEITTNERWLNAGAFDIQGLRPIPGAVLIKRLGTLDPTVVSRIGAAAKLWLAL